MTFMDKDITCVFYDYLLRIIGAESRDKLYDYIYDNAQTEFADMLFPDDDERHYKFQSFFEHHIGKLEKEQGLIVVKYKNEKPKEIGLTELGVSVCSHGSYAHYISEREATQKRIEEEERIKKEVEANEHKWNIRNNIVQFILGIITIMSIISEWVFSKTCNIHFTISAFIAGCLLGYGVKNRINKH